MIKRIKKKDDMKKKTKMDGKDVKKKAEEWIEAEVGIEVS